MSARPIGYYVHHHGDGHRQRALILARHLDGRAVLLGTGLAGRTGAVPAIDLDDDRRPGDCFSGHDESERPEALHYAPIDHEGVRRRVARIAAWIARARPALMIVDVSVEVAMLARLASVPTVYVRLGGRRDDPAHRDAFRGAAALLAPFHADLDDPTVPDRVRARTIYAPGLAPRSPCAVPDDRLVLGVAGRGGSRITGEHWAAAARSMPGYRWRVLGPCAAPGDMPGNLDFAGWSDDPAAEIARAGIVVGAAGDGVVGAVLAARRPFLCVPEDRPFGEQTAKAARLAATGAAVVSAGWPAGAAWPDLLRAAARLDPARAARLDDPDGARSAGVRLLAIADGLPLARTATS